MNSATGRSRRAQSRLQWELSLDATPGESLNADSPDGSHRDHRRNADKDARRACQEVIDPREAAGRKPLQEFQHTGVDDQRGGNREIAGASKVSTIHRVRIGLEVGPGAWIGVVVSRRRLPPGTPP